MLTEIDSVSFSSSVIFSLLTERSCVEDGELFLEEAVSSPSRMITGSMFSTQKLQDVCLSDVWALTKVKVSCTGLWNISLNRWSGWSYSGSRSNKLKVSVVKRCLVSLCVASFLCSVGSLKYVWVFSTQYATQEYCKIWVRQASSIDSYIEHLLSVQESLHKCWFAPLLTRCCFTVLPNENSKGSRGVITVCLVYIRIQDMDQGPRPTKPDFVEKNQKSLSKLPLKILLEICWKLARLWVKYLGLKGNGAWDPLLLSQWCLRLMPSEWKLLFNKHKHQQELCMQNIRLTPGTWVRFSIPHPYACLSALRLR